MKGAFNLKSYAEFLRGYIGKKGVWHDLGDKGLYEFTVNDDGGDKFVDVGTDYAEFDLKYGHPFAHIVVPLNLLIFRIK